MQQLLEMIMKAASQLGIKIDPSSLDLASLMSKVSNLNSLKEELVDQFGSKLGLDNDIVKNLLSKIDLNSLNLDELKNFDLSKLDLNSIASGAGLAGLAGMGADMMGGFDGLKDTLGGILGGHKDAELSPTEVVSEEVVTAVEAAPTLDETPQDIASNEAEVNSEVFGNVTEQTGEVVSEEVANTVDVEPTLDEASQDIALSDAEVYGSVTEPTEEVVSEEVANTMETESGMVDVPQEMMPNEMASNEIASNDMMSNDMDVNSDMSEMTMKPTEEVVFEEVANTMETESDMVDAPLDMTAKDVEVAADMSSPTTTNVENPESNMYSDVLNKVEDVKEGVTEDVKDVAEKAGGFFDSIKSIFDKK